MTDLLTLRPDTRPWVGLGHLARSLGIAVAWQKAGGRVRIFVDPGRDGTIDSRASEMVATAMLPPAEVASGGATAGIDAVDFSAGPGWIVLDGYDFPIDLQRRARSLGKLLVVDDQASLGQYDADLVLDQNVLLPGTMHEGVKPENVLRGLDYVCLRPDALAPLDAKSEGVIGILAGGDPKQPTRQIIRTIAKAANCPVRLIAMPWAEDIKGPTVGHRPFAAPLHRNLDGVSVAVAPAGSTAWELCALGIPSVLFATASNQKAVGRVVAEAGAGIFAGSTDDFGPAALADRVVAGLRVIIDKPHQRTAMAQSGRALIDGRGAARVFAEMRSAQLELRPVTWSDVDLLFEWANDPVARAMAFSSEPIPRSDHETWLRNRLNRQAGLHWIAWLDGQPIGQVRFDRRNHHHEISISLDERARGRRLAAPLIIAGGRALVAAIGDDALVRAQVKRANPASLIAFDTARYSVVKAPPTGPSFTGPNGRNSPGESDTAVQLSWSGDLNLH